MKINWVTHFISSNYHCSVFLDVVYLSYLFYDTKKLLHLQLDEIVLFLIKRNDLSLQ